MPPDIRWQQRFANFCQALEQLETFFQPPALNERERQGPWGATTQVPTSTSSWWHQTSATTIACG
jgi:hypothetical protein